ncbi:MAG: RNA/single-stranded DNA exonuclease, partial [Clostridia bacterium]|nr:RNA/single-stranded DNA exonuclease [Clostridia bacterium]
EMVTELIQYVPFDVKVPQVCAEALMSGITLDTKNFVMKTGVRTFEAAAYLRSLGADTVAVKQLFANSMQTQKAKSEVVKSAAMYNECAIGVVDFEVDDIRIVASQAADELLNIDGVKASFVLFRTDNVINISARSYGEINVQIIMEKLGGGGHHTMAAAQLADETFDNALALLKNAINNEN